ncbi:MAG: helix-turn-helix transcriptional regulator, partial [Oscillospiraceae bacterium]|nr:helix-turn-helix transcriptional regulator [Oscillospiraceae bacterium]
MEKLNIILYDKRMTKNKLLTELNLGRNSYQNWKKEGSKPRTETMKKIADYFNVDFDSLLYDDLELQYNSPVGNCNAENGGTKKMKEHNDFITEEKYKEMYELASKRV